MTREEALQLVESKVKNKNLVKHMLAVEACMRKLAKKFSKDEDSWGVAGLLHDLDYDQTKDDFSQHGLVAASVLEGEDVLPEVIDAIKAHPGHCPRETLMAKALYAVDPLSGLIIAAALMHPEKKLASLNPQFVLNRFKEKHFARGAKREQIKACAECGISLEEFVELCLKAMQEIDNALGL